MFLASRLRSAWRIAIRVVGVSSSYGAGDRTVSVPSGVVDGDLLVIFGVTRSTSNNIWTPVSGFTERLDSVGRVIQTRTASSEPSSYTVSTPTLESDVCLVALRRASYGSNGGLGTASTDPIAPSVTLSNRGAVLGFFSHNVNDANSTIYPPSNFLPLYYRGDGSTRPVMNIGIKDFLAGATGNLQGISNMSLARGCLVALNIT